MLSSLLWGTALILMLMLTGCLRFKPVEDPARYFVLAASSQAPASTNHSTQALGIGIGPVTLASYLENNRLPLRRSDHEIVYSSQHLWAERLEKALPRVLALNLGRFLGSDRIQIGSWGRGDVAYEVHVTMHRFEWTESGQATLEAQWQIRQPGAETMTAGGFTEIQSAGPVLSEDPDGAVATLNDLLMQMSRQIADKLAELARARRPD